MEKNPFRNSFGSAVVVLWQLMLVMALFSIQRILFYLFNVGYFPGIAFIHLCRLLLEGLRFDLSALLYINSLYILLMLLPVKGRLQKGINEFGKWLFFGTNGIALIGNFVDIVYFRYILRRSDFSMFTEFQHESQLWKLVLVGLIQYWYLVALFLLMMFVLVVLYRGQKEWVTPKRSRYNWLISLTVMLVMGGLAIAGIRGGFSSYKRPINVSNSLEKVQYPIESAIVLNTPFSIFQTIETKQIEPINFFPEPTASAFYTPLHAGSPTGSFKPMNVVVIILESFTKEVVGSLNPELEQGHYKGYTPFLDSLVQQSRTWQYSYANGMKSIDAIPSVIAGIPCLSQSYVQSPYLMNTTSGLAATLQEKGYDAGFYHGARNGSMGFDAVTNLFSIRKYFGMKEYGTPEDADGYWGIPDEPFLKYCAHNLKLLKEPFLATIFTLSSHHPYRLPTKYGKSFNGGPNPLYKCVEYTDFALRNFFREASKQPWFGNTLFVLTADHSLPSRDHPEYITQNGHFSIPVIFYRPGGELKGLDSTLIQQIDIFPSILGYLQYDAPYFAFGRDRFNANETPFVINYVNGYYQYMEGDWLLQSDGHRLLAAFRYKLDKQFRNNLADSGDREMLRHYDRFRAFLQQYNNRMIKNELMIRH